MIDSVERLSGFHAVESHPGMSQAWTGPGLESRILLCIEGAEPFAASITIVDTMHEANFEELRICCNGRGQRIQVERWSETSGRVLFPVTFQPGQGAELDIVIRAPRVLRPANIRGGGDSRALGIAISEVALWLPD